MVADLKGVVQVIPEGAGIATPGSTWLAVLSITTTYLSAPELEREGKVNHTLPTSVTVSLSGSSDTTA